MPLLPASLIEPLWVELAALIGSDERPEFAPTHPWGCHRRRIPDRVVFEHLIGAFVHGSGYERIATPGCSDRTMRRRLRRVGRRRARARAAADLPDRLRPDHRARPRRAGRGRLHHQGPVRRRGRRPLPGGPGQTGHEALGGHRRARHPAAPGRGPRQRPRLAAAGADPGRHLDMIGTAAAVPRPARRRRLPEPAPRPRLRLGQDPRPARRPRVHPRQPITAHVTAIVRNSTSSRCGTRAGRDLLPPQAHDLAHHQADLAGSDDAAAVIPTPGI